MIHVVRKGDVLWQIADYYEADINDIIAINGLINPNLLLEGQSLLIPTPGLLANPNFIYPEVKLTIPQKPRPPIEVNAFTYVFGENDIRLLRDSIEYLTYLTPFAYIVNEAGELYTINDEWAIQFAIANNVVPVMSVANYSFNNSGAHIAHDIFNNMDVSTDLINNIIYILREKGYRGVKFDFENVLPEDKEAYNNFLQMASSTLHTQGYFVSTALAPQDSYEQRGLFNEAHDYDAHGKIVDYVVLMTYKGEMLSSIDNIKSVLDYALSTIPREKIFIGLQLAAVDRIVPYTQGQQQEEITIQEAMNRAYRHRAQIHYDENRQLPYYFYRDDQGRMHEVWLEDARSIQAKLDLIKGYGIRGITYWILGYPFNVFWHLLEDNFMIVKD